MTSTPMNILLNHFKYFQAQVKDLVVVAHKNSLSFIGMNGLHLMWNCRKRGILTSLLSIKSRT